MKIIIKFNNLLKIRYFVNMKVFIQKYLIKNVNKHMMIYLII